MHSSSRICTTPEKYPVRLENNAVRWLKRTPRSQRATCLLVPSLHAYAGKIMRGNPPRFQAILRVGGQCPVKRNPNLIKWQKQIKWHCDQEMKDCRPANGGKKKKDPNTPKRPLSGFFYSALNPTPRSNPQLLASPLEM